MHNQARPISNEPRSCPLCHHYTDNIEEHIPVSQLVGLYKRLFSCDIGYLFTDADVINYKLCPECGLGYFDPPITGDTAFYEAMEQTPGYYIDEKAEYHIAKRYIEAGNKVLEVGSGKGVFAEFIPGTDYTGLEFSPKAILLANEKGVKLVNQTVEDHATNQKSSYDVVCSFQVLEHVAQPYSFIKGAVDCLKPGGYLIIAVPNDRSFFRYAVNNPLNLPPHHISRWQQAPLDFIARHFDLSVVKRDVEVLQDNHVHWYFKVWLTYWLSGIVRMPYRSIRPGIGFRLLEIKASLLGRLFAKRFPKALRPNGHTISYIYQKPPST